MCVVVVATRQAAIGRTRMAATIQPYTAAATTIRAATRAISRTTGRTGSQQSSPAKFAEAKVGAFAPDEHASTELIWAGPASLLRRHHLLRRVGPPRRFPLSLRGCGPESLRARCVVSRLVPYW